jgi:hypothetical protein
MALGAALELEATVMRVVWWVVGCVVVMAGAAAWAVGTTMAGAPTWVVLTGGPVIGLLGGLLWPPYRRGRHSR